MLPGRVLTAIASKIEEFLGSQPRSGGRRIAAFQPEGLVLRGSLAGNLCRSQYVLPIGEHRGVFLYAIDDLRAACERNQKRRERELPKAIKIVDKEADRFMSDLHYRATSPVVRQLRLQWEHSKEKELRRLLNKLPELDDRAEREIHRSFDRVTNKLLHPALESLRVESHSGIPTALLDAVSRLFQFKD